MLQESQNSDCDHSPTGLCSKCVLFRAYALKTPSTSEDKASASLALNAVDPTRASTSMPSLAREGSVETCVTSTSMLSFTVPASSRFRFLPVSSLHSSLTMDTPSLPASTAITTEPLSMDPSKLNDSMTRLGSFEDLASTKISRKSSPSSATTLGREEEADTYTSFAAFREDIPPEIHRKDLSSTCGDRSVSQMEGEVARSVTPPQPQSWLLRLFESDLCDISLTLQYLHTAKEKGVKSYLGNKLFQLPPESVDFYVPQLLNMLLNFEDAAEVVQPYIVERCKRSRHFSLHCCWLLDAFGFEQRIASLGNIKAAKAAVGELLRLEILSDFRAAAECKGRLSEELVRRSSLRVPTRSTSNGLLSDCMEKEIQDGMRRVESAMTTLRHLMPPIEGLPSGSAFDNGCTCLKEEAQESSAENSEEDQFVCECGAPRLRGEQEFVRALTIIGERLRIARTKREKSCRLVSELHLLNAQLPARVWIPLYSEVCEHIVLRIPPTSGCVLNSKDKAPYCIYVEVLTCTNAQSIRIPQRICEVDAESHELLQPETQTDHNGFSLDGETVAHRRIEDYRNDSKKEDNQLDNITEMQWWHVESVSHSGEMASDTMSQKSVESSSLGTSEGKSTLHADLSRRLRQWVKRPRKQMRNLPDDPSAHAMSEPWDEKKERLRMSSPYGSLPGWKLLPVIVKTGDDLRQELLAYQLLRTLETIWKEEQVPLFLRPYKIMILSHDSGMIEPIVDACSLHQIKRDQSHVFREEGRMDTPSLLTHFLDTFGPAHSETFIRAQENLVRSTAGYSLACYFLQVKDRHNGNILIDAEGHLIHIDFGYILSASPRNLGFETSPFKLTSEIVDVMGGASCELFAHFKALMLKGMLATRKHLDRIMNIVEIMIHGSPLACFRGGTASLRIMRERFHLTSTEEQLKVLINHMVESSRDSLTTRLYDNYQYYSNGIL